MLLVKRFCCDNSVSIEFDLQTVKVKDLVSRGTWVKDFTRSIYESIRFYKLIQVEVGAKANARLWHMQWGHLHSRAVTRLNKKRLTDVSNVHVIHSSCDCCSICKTQKLPHVYKSIMYSPDSRIDICRHLEVVSHSVDWRVLLLP